MKLVQIISGTHYYIPGWLDLQIKIDLEDGSLPGVHRFVYDPGDQIGLSPAVRDALPAWLETNTLDAWKTPEADLLDYSANVRYNIETGGVPMMGSVIATDRQSQAMITGAFSYVSQNPSAIINFKTTTGWIQANSQLIVMVANAVGTHVQACFSAEQAVDSKISSGEIIDTGGVDSYYAGLRLGTGFVLDGTGYSPGRADSTFIADCLFDSSFDVEASGEVDFNTMIFYNGTFSLQDESPEVDFRTESLFTSMGTSSGLSDVTGVSQ